MYKCGIDKPGAYKTREGVDARVYALDGAGYRKIHGAIWTKEGWDARQWHEGGIYSLDGESLYDLVPLKLSRDDVMQECCAVYMETQARSGLQSRAVMAVLDHYDQLRAEGRI
jgi:hypothetical protein